MSNDTKLTPIELLRAISPDGAKTYLEHRAAIMDDPRFQTLLLKIKLLVGIGLTAIAAALGSAVGSHVTVKASPSFVKVAFGFIMWFFAVEIALHLLRVV